MKPLDFTVPYTTTDLMPGRRKVVFCDNPLCDSPAIRSVAVSVKRVGDAKRSYCATCLEAYYVGVQHGRLRVTAEFRAESRARGCRGRSAAKRHLPN